MKPASPSKEDLRAAYVAAMAFALALTRSKARAQDVVQDAFERLLTTRPWDPSKGPLDAHMMGIVRSLLNIARRSASARNEARAHEEYHAEVVGRQTESAEHETLEHAGAEERRTAAATVLEQLTARVAAHPVAPGVLRCRAEGLQKAGDIATALGVPVDQVYRANELLKEQLQKIREAD
jgi:DNA-directed RNA polymerase specialized sigma24 family protein